MMLSRLARLSVLSLLLGRSSGIESPPANDAGALKNTVREVVDLLDDGATLASSQGDSSVWWNSGEFTFERSQVAVPSGQAQAYWYCSGGREGIYNRLMLFAPNVTYDEIAIDTDTWQDPIVEAWNATLNAEAIDRIKLVSFSIGGGSGCGCEWFQLNFGEWLKSNSEAGSVMATDHYQSRASDPPPRNWYYPPEPQYLPSGYDADMIQNVYTGTPMSSVSSGWQSPTILKGRNLITTSNIYLRIENDGGPVTLRAMSNSPRAYGIVAYLWKENSDPSDKQDNGPINPMELYTKDVSDVTEATAMTFAAIPEGYYYSLFISNRFEDQTKYSSLPPYDCTMGPNGLSTEYEITYSLQTCAEEACNAGKIAVVVDPVPPSPTPSTSSAKTVTGRISAALFTVFYLAYAFIE